MGRYIRDSTDIPVTALSELVDVDSILAIDKNLLRFDSLSGKWVNITEQQLTPPLSIEGGTY